MDYRKASQTTDVDEIRAYISALELPEASLEPEALPAGVTLPQVPDYKVGVQQAVTVGSQIAEYAAALPAEMRSDISNCFLLAQLAADKFVATHPGTEDQWYGKYFDVMAKCGWMIEEAQEAVKTVNGTGISVHKQIISVLTAVLGPALTAASVIMETLKGLQAMSPDQPFITLFDHASQRAKAKLFQISYVSAGPDKSPRIDLAAYNLEAGASATQVLFFNVALSDATLTTFGSKLSINAAVFQQIRGAVFEKVKDRIVGNVASIDI